MFESIILGLIQGITEWLPISSEGLITLVEVNLFHPEFTMTQLIGVALFLHLGTFMAALVYFKREVWQLLKGLFNYNKIDLETRSLLNFYIIATFFSGIVALIILEFVEDIENQFVFTGKAVTLLIAVLLLITAILQFQKKKKGKKEIIDLKNSDGILLGIIQGFSILPGLSRSGLTVSALLLRRFKDMDALRISFLMSLPVVLGGNILLNIEKFALTSESIVGLFFSFLLGILTIHFLLNIAQKIKFGWFVLILSIITFISILV